MKKIYNPLLIVLLVITGFTSLAQNSPFEFGVKGGLNLSSLSFNNNTIPTNRIKPGVNIGFTTTYNFRQNFFLQSGLSFTTKGAEIKGEAPMGFDYNLVYPGREAVLKSNQLYLQVPIYAGYRLDVLPGTRLVLTAGPYVAYGIGGKTQLTGDILYGDMIDYSTLEEKTFASRGLERFDVGIGTGIGVDFGRAIVGLTYELGLKDIGPSGTVYWPFYSNSYKNRNASLSLEYKF
ncbi:outer membrane beta-barrel protein [Spirosoma sp. HMF4905]|uniref:Outer membrane beta-barrel protein n=1 Tax=Spirosoma arboris TaxID=2682092 RepID=A0A7K1S4W1_9BACT|nr:porin family protein [Spirosoma arboris]MVM28666.1 outer membrane beta-barrel protein [Spirosoma arboris]